jgi:hypothetical protein
MIMKMGNIQIDLFGRPVKLKSRQIEPPKVVNITDTERPFFVKIDGCINCENYKQYQAIRKAHQLPQPHEYMFMCLVVCKLTHNVFKPYIGNHELVRLIETRRFQDGSFASEDALETARKILVSRG